MARISRLRGPGGPELFTLPREPREIAPGAVHVPDWLDLAEQIALVERCRSWVRGVHRMRHQVMAGGGVMSVQSTVLGRTWGRPWAPMAGRATETTPGAASAADASSGHGREEVTGELLPQPLVDLGRRGVAAAYGGDSPEAASFEPTTALINFYDAAAAMGMHQDRDESGPEPIVSLSLGDACIFRFGGPESRSQAHQDVELRSGDLFVFGRASRWAYHGVPAVRPGTGDPALGMRGGGRLNITIRRTQPSADHGIGSGTARLRRPGSLAGPATPHHERDAAGHDTTTGGHRGDRDRAAGDRG
ncbi:alpha-ketoglutarate-dependent dioxygenase AlkB [Kocuria palustris]|uniref:alpha-ketoglutarate-dependent dioxygenase AlkB n=1 Tax=Kocuria palustris TaxID=71999 RepID=UPI0011A731FB|nr:alpha-ketoglutarate-dependent dioxygenase AlkB [Kocuria palustris]